MPMNLGEASARTAISRTRASAPARAIVSHIEGRTVLDWGAGGGIDVDFYRNQGAARSVGYDPNYPPPADALFPEWDELGMFDVVTCTYVANVLPPRDRRLMLVQAWRHAREKLIVSVRTDKVKGTPHEDGVVTSRGTFQKSYRSGELVAYLRRLFPRARVSQGPRVSGASIAIVK